MKKFTLIISLLIICSTLRAQMPPPPVLSPQERWTQLWSVSYDYQTNGSIRYLVQDPSNPAGLCSILMSQQDSSNASGVQRYIYYTYSDDYGNTWNENVLDVSASWGFPDMSLSNGNPIIATHKFNVISNVFEDSPFGAFSFSIISGQPTNVIASWPHLSGTSNGNVVMAASTNDGAALGGFYATYDGTSWIGWNPLPLIGGPSGNFSVESGTNGVVGIFGTDYAGTGAVIYYKSIDNGITFDNGTDIFDYQLDGGDTLFANILGGLQAVYVADEPHLVFTAYNVDATIFPNPNTVAYIKPKILHWSPSTGLSEVAGRFNIPNITDTVTTLLIEPVCQPSISSTSSGKLICTFTAFLRGNTQVVDNGDDLNAGEILATISSDNGATWSTPVNITNTPDVEEKHSSLINHSVTDSLNVFYIRDLKAGGWVNNTAWGKAPVYGIFKKTSLVGISQINTQVVSYELSQNYPNPFNPTTNIKFSIPKSNFTTLIIYDEVGREITRLVNQRLNTGSYVYEFSGDKYNLSSGVYYYKLISGDFIQAKQMVLIK
jgi:hypothetical protein